MSFIKFPFFWGKKSINNRWQANMSCQESISLISLDSIILSTISRHNWQHLDTLYSYNTVPFNLHKKLSSSGIVKNLFVFKSSYMMMRCGGWGFKRVSKIKATKLNPSLFLCLSQARIWIVNTICHGLFYVQHF